jgi:hypothetical protein
MIRRSSDAARDGTDEAEQRIGAGGHRQGRGQSGTLLPACGQGHAAQGQTEPLAAARMRGDECGQAPGEDTPGTGGRRTEELTRPDMKDNPHAGQG